jgi:gliding motility-associated-like protein
MTLSTTKTDVLCYGDANGTIDLTVGSGQSPYTYQWDNTSTVQDPNGLIAGTYSVVVTDNAGCTATISETVGTPQAIVLTDTHTDPTCSTLADDGVITINTTGGIAPYQYTWSNSATTSSLQSLSPGNYSVVVSDLNSCTATATFTLSYIYDFAVKATPAVTIDLAESATLSYTITGNSGNVSTVWSPSYGLSCTDCGGPTAAPSKSTLYQIDIKNDAGCTASDTTSVYVIPNYNIFIPSAFTPNGDGNNDLFQIYGNLKALKFVEINIFNRWGERVFKSNDINFTWDGTYIGGLLEPGTLVYDLSLVFIDDHSDGVKKGSLTLLR